MRKLLLFLCCMSIWLCAPARAVAAVTGGDGWSYDSDSERLTITGDYVWAERGAGGGPAKNPWYEYRWNISRITIEEGVTSIGDDAFADCVFMWDFKLLSTTISSVGKSAFKNCKRCYWDNLVPWNSQSLTSIGNSAFWGSKEYSYQRSEEYKLAVAVPPVLGKDVFNFTSDDVRYFKVSGESFEAFVNSDWAKYFVIVPVTIEGDGWSYDGEDRWYPRLTINGDYVWAVRDNDSAARNPWYEFRKSIKYVALDDGVTSIGDDAFADCNLVSVDYGDAQVRTIGRCAFKSKMYLDRAFPVNTSSLTSIGDSAFYGNRIYEEDLYQLKAVVPPALGKDVFSYTPSDSLYLIVPTESVEAYKSSDWAKYFIISPESGEGWSYDKDNRVLTITGDFVWPVGDLVSSSSYPWSAFCNSVRHIIFGEGVTNIGDYAFAGCSNYLHTTALRLAVNYSEAQVKTIGKSAFGHGDLVDVFPWFDSASLTSIGDSAFYGLRNDRQYGAYQLENVVPPALGNGVFNLTPSDSVMLIVPTESYAAYKESDWAKYFVIVPVTIEGDGWSYDGEDWDPRLTINGDYVWAVRDNDSAARNPWYEFRKSIEYVALDDGVTSIGDDAFVDCGCLYYVDYGNAQVKTVGKCAFKGEGHLDRTFPVNTSSLTSIGDSAFYGKWVSKDDSYRLKAVAPPALGKGVFSFTASDSITLYVPNESVEAYESSDWAKYFVIVPGTVDGDGWSYDKGSGELTIKGDYVWAVRDNDTPARNPWYELRDRIRYVTLEDGVTSIGDDAFADCKYDLIVDYGNAQVKTIGKCAFKSKSSGYLATVFRGNTSSLTSIGDSAFYGRWTYWDDSYQLKAVVPPILGKGVFFFTQSSYTFLYVPSESVAAYEASDWAKYFVIEGYQSTAIDAVPAEPGPRPKVENGVVTVGGEPAREVYSLSGRRMPAGVPLPRGIYVVATPAGAVRVAVK